MNIGNSSYFQIQIEQRTTIIVKRKITCFNSQLTKASHAKIHIHRNVN